MENTEYLVNFLNEKSRMCSSMNDCIICPLYNYKNTGIKLCRPSLSEQDIIKQVAVVTDWSKNHPKKTRQDRFNELFPKAQMSIDGHPGVCCKNLGFPATCWRQSTCAHCWLHEDDFDDVK